MAYSLNVDGKTVSVDADADMPLLWVLREKLGNVGPKFGCGLGQCGACTVHIDGEAVQSCQTPISAIGASKVVTIQAIGADPIGRELQQAWAELDVAQCGYCQAGQIMSAAALLKRKPRPTDADIDSAMDVNICRCATYVRIRKAIRRASGQKEA